MAGSGPATNEWEERLKLKVRRAFRAAPTAPAQNFWEQRLYALTARCAGEPGLQIVLKPDQRKAKRDRLEVSPEASRCAPNRFSKTWRDRANGLWNESVS